MPSKLLRRLELLRLKHKKVLKKHEQMQNKPVLAELDAQNQAAEARRQADIAQRATEAAQAAQKNAEEQQQIAVAQREEADKQRLAAEAADGASQESPISGGWHSQWRSRRKQLIRKTA